MTHTPREPLRPPAECDEPIGIPDIRRLETDGELNASSFNQQFSHCREMLHFVACRILTSVDAAENAVRNCHRKASQNPPQFQDEGAFKSWLLRILIDEATLLLRTKRHPAPSPKRIPEGN